MKVTIQQLKQASALRIANEWRYPEEYGFYNKNHDPEAYAAFVSAKQRGNHYWQVTVSGVLMGYFGIWPTKTSGAYVLAVGMAPASTDQGYGRSFVAAVIDFVRTHYEIDTLIVSVAAFNVRAQKVFLSLGFTITRHYQRSVSGNQRPYVEMRGSL